MTRDRDVNLGDLSNVTVDDTPRRPGAASQPRPAPGATTQKTASAPRAAKRQPAHPKPKASFSGGGWMGASLALLVLLAVMGGWFHSQMSGLQAKLDASLNSSSQQLGNLQSQLSATDESLNQSSGALRDTVAQHSKQLAENASEIRKLWDLSNKRNRAAIDAQAKKLTALTAKVSKVEAAQAAVDGKIKTINDTAAALKKQLESAVEAINTSSQQWQSQISQMRTQLEVMVENIHQLERAQAELKAAVAQMAEAKKERQAMAAQLSDIEAAIAAFDAYRLQVNGRLDQLERR